MLDPVELAETADAFGVSDAQVLRDHLISHILLALGHLDADVTFFGGTALARTHLADPATGARMSEDIDLLSVERRAVAAQLDNEVPGLLRREFPAIAWDPALSGVRATEPAQLVTRDGLRVRIQLLDARSGHPEFQRFPTEMRTIGTRYQDAAGALRLRVPTLTGFAAMKTIAWMDRRTSRDLYDLAGLATSGALTPTAADLVRKVSGYRVTRALIDQSPSDDWSHQLGHQTRTLPTERACRERVLTEYAAALGWE